MAPSASHLINRRQLERQRERERRQRWQQREVCHCKWWEQGTSAGSRAQTKVRRRSCVLVTRRPVQAKVWARWTRVWCLDELDGRRGWHARREFSGWDHWTRTRPQLGQAPGGRRVDVLETPSRKNHRSKRQEALTLASGLSWRHVSSRQPGIVVTVSNLCCGFVVASCRRGQNPEAL